jgi:hypothetical protein
MLVLLRWAVITAAAVTRASTMSAFCAHFITPYYNNQSLISIQNIEQKHRVSLQIHK